MGISLGRTAVKAYALTHKGSHWLPFFCLQESEQDYQAAERIRGEVCNERSREHGDNSMQRIRKREFAGGTRPALGH